MARDNLSIGDCEVYWKEVFLGETLGGIDFDYERKFVDMVVDKYGEAPVDMALSGSDLKIKCPLAEPTTLNLYKAMPEGRYAESTPGGDNKLGLGRRTGYRLSQDAGLLRLHPRKNTPSNRNDDIYIWLAVSHENIKLKYTPKDQRILEITFRALVDESQADGEHLGRIGDATIS